VSFITRPFTCYLIQGGHVTQTERDNLEEPSRAKAALRPVEPVSYPQLIQILMGGETSLAPAMNFTAQSGVNGLPDVQSKPNA
jgi:hypothetical protein